MLRLQLRSRAASQRTNQCRRARVFAGSGARDGARQRSPNATWRIRASRLRLARLFRPDILIEKLGKLGGYEAIAFDGHMAVEERLTLF